MTKFTKEHSSKLTDGQLLFRLQDFFGAEQDASKVGDHEYAQECADIVSIIRELQEYRNAAPQLPQPAVVDKNGLLPCPFCGDIACVVDNRLGFYVKCSDDDCDAVAIGPRVPELQSEQEERSIDWRALEQSAKDKWNRRAAMLQAGNSPATPDGSKEALSEAVAAIYFDDSSDYCSALWSVVRAISPKIAELLESNERAAFDATRLPAAPQQEVK